MSKYLRILMLTVSLYGGTVNAQIPVEVFTGTERATIDIMFFRFFKDRQNEHSRFLFFNRTRAGLDYNMTRTTNLPQFGFTEAFSYNHQKLGGFAPVIVFQAFNSGVHARAGIQYAFLNEKFTLFSWFVSETAQKPDIDHYILIRFLPDFPAGLRLFTQMELSNTYQSSSASYRFSQRLRLGLRKKNFQFGAGIDLAESGKRSFMVSANPGLFLRTEF